MDAAAAQASAADAQGDASPTERGGLCSSYGKSNTIECSLWGESNWTADEREIGLVSS